MTKDLRNVLGMIKNPKVFKGGAFLLVGTAMGLYGTYTMEQGMTEELTKLTTVESVEVEFDILEDEEEEEISEL